jgi:hypothetical protein
MPATAKHRTVTDKISSLIWCELHFGCAAFTHFDFNIQVANADPVRHVCTLEYEHHWLALLQSDFPRFKIKALRRNLDPLRGSFSPSHRRRKPRGQQGRGQQNQLHILPLHKLSFEVGDGRVEPPENKAVVSRMSLASTHLTAILISP